jgi:MoaA/NifB/PqqE/SkfB family radical SAM enzyme
LNCVGCTVFSPLCDGGFADLNSFDKDIKQIGILTNGEVERIVLMGGEPLLHPQIIDFLKITRKYIKTGEIAIITNGILLLKQGVSFWGSCKTNEIRIYITPYPIKLDYEQIIKIAEKYSVNVEYFYMGNKTSFRKLPLNIEGKKDIIENFKRCTGSNTCVALRDGKMYGCQTIAYIDYFNSYFGQNFKVLEKDYIDIHTATSEDEILDFMCKPLPFCRYCDVDSMKFGIKWSISKKEIGEWT